MDNRIFVKLLSRLVESIDQKVLIDLIKASDFDLEDSTESTNCFSRRELIIIHTLARRKGKHVVTKFLFSDKRVLDLVSFMPQRCISKNIPTMALPIFSCSKNNLEEVFSLNLSRYFPFESLVRIKELLPLYGVTLLNNLTELKYYAKAYRGDWRDFFALDHTQEIDHFEYHPTFLYKELLEHYSLKRVFRLMVTAKDYDDLTASTFHEDLQRLIGRPKEIVDRVLPSRPRSLQGLSSTVNRRIQSILHEGVALNQKLSPLDGAHVGEFQIEVPKFAEDLISLSKELNNCLDTYIRKVLEGKRNILVLKKDEKRCYALELDVRGDYCVLQFRGKSNSDEMEGEAGEKIIRQLFTILKTAPVV